MFQLVGSLLSKFLLAALFVSFMSCLSDFGLTRDNENILKPNFVFLTDDMAQIWSNDHQENKKSGSVTKICH